MRDRRSAILRKARESGVAVGYTVRARVFGAAGTDGEADMADRAAVAAGRHNRVLVGAEAALTNEITHSNRRAEIMSVGMERFVERRTG